jgi:hypothetical protein
VKGVEVSAPAANIPQTHIFNLDRRRKNFLQYIFALYSIDPVDLEASCD